MRFVRTDAMVPVAILARLAVDQRHSGRRICEGLLRDVMLRTVAAAEGIGCRGPLVHCEGEEARGWYEHLELGFEASPTDLTHLYAHIKDVRRACPTHSL